MECMVCHQCKLFWYQPKGQNVQDVVHPPCQSPVRAVKRPPKDYQESSPQKMAA
jgi:hypothetical protein